jgi:group I intron endonuclease
MNGATSTTKKKEVIWEENHSTELQMKSESNGASGVCDITAATSGSNESVPLTATTKISGIYKILNKANGKYYVGSSIDLNKRWSSHKKSLIRNKHPNIHLQRAWNKYGMDNFEFGILEYVNENDLLKHEQKYLEDEDENRYNICRTAGNTLGIKASSETRLKMSLQRRGVKRCPCSEERKRKQSKTLKERYKNGLEHPLKGKHHICAGANHYLYGKHRPEEIRQKISTTLRGVPLSQERKEKLSLVRRDKTIHNLVNIQTNEAFTGTKQDFIRKYNNGKRCYPIYQMFKGLRTYHEWKLKSLSIHS